MVRKSSFVIGLGLALFWAIGLGLNPHATMLWFSAVAAIFAFTIASVADETEHRPANALGPGLLGLGLAVLWIVGVASRAPGWVSWLNFLFAIASFAVAAMAVSGRQIHIHGHSHARA